MRGTLRKIAAATLATPAAGYSLVYTYVTSATWDSPCGRPCFESAMLLTQSWPHWLMFASVLGILVALLLYISGHNAGLPRYSSNRVRW